MPQPRGVRVLEKTRADVHVHRPGGDRRRDPQSPSQALQGCDEYEALEIARQLGIPVAINLIAGPDWDERRFEIVRQWALEVPGDGPFDRCHALSGTETWITSASELTTLDYRLFDIQHAVMPTRLPLKKFYEELVKTQRVLGDNHMGFGAMRGAAAIAVRLLLKGQTNFDKMLWKFNKVYNADGSTPSTSGK